MCLSRLPFFGLILQRLHSFSTDVIDRKACVGQLVALAGDLRDTRFEELGHSSVYQVTSPNLPSFLSGGKGGRRVVHVSTVCGWPFLFVC